MLAFCSICCFLSCSPVAVDDPKMIDPYLKARRGYVSNLTGYHSEIRRKVEDWIIQGQEDGTWILHGYEPGTYMVDPVMFFNSDSTKVVGVVISSNSLYKDAKADSLKGFQGVKIDGRWYFFSGASVILLRETCHYDPYEPLSWEELEYLSFIYYMRKFCNVENDQIYPLANAVDKYVGMRVSILYPEGETDENWIKSYYSYKSKKVTDRIIKNRQDQIYHSVRPDFDIVKPEYTWWDRLKGVEIPLFETNEWINRKKTS